MKIFLLVSMRGAALILVATCFDCGSPRLLLGIRITTCFSASQGLDGDGCSQTIRFRPKCPKLSPPRLPSPASVTCRSVFRTSKSTCAVGWPIGRSRAPPRPEAACSRSSTATAPVTETPGATDAEDYLLSVKSLSLTLSLSCALLPLSFIFLHHRDRSVFRWTESGKHAHVRLCGF